MYENVLSEIFDYSMRHESKTITEKYSGETFKAFFRKSNDGQQTKDSMTMYYYHDAPVSIGSIISFAGNDYLLLNKETWENDVYFKSAVIRCNGVINNHGLTVFDLPCFAESVSSATASENNNISIINGSMEILTSDCSASRALNIDDTFNEWGRTWKIENLYYIDGICHIVIVVNVSIVDPTINYRLELSALSILNVAPGDSAQLTATAYINDREIEDAEIVFSSSDDSVAVIDAAGNISYLADGEVFFSASWQSEEKKTDTVTVATAPAGDVYDIYVEELPEIADGFEETISYYVVHGGVRDDSIPVSFKAENISNYTNQSYWLKKVSLVDNGDHTLTVKADDVAHHTFELVAYNTEYKLENRQTVKVISLF